MQIFSKTTLILFSLFLSTYVKADDNRSVPLEVQVKAALIFNFSKFIDWPPDSFANDTSPIDIGIVGNDPFGRVLDEAVEGQVVHGRKIQLNRLTPDSNLRNNHILFISSSEEKNLKSIIASIRGASVVTISDIPDFDKLGGTIALYLKENHVKFAINIAAADQARVKINSQLLKMSQANN